MSEVKQEAQGEKLPWADLPACELTDQVMQAGVHQYVYLTRPVPVNREFGTEPQSVMVVRVINPSCFEVDGVLVSIQHNPESRNLNGEPHRSPVRLVVQRGEDPIDPIDVILSLDLCHRLVRCLTDLIERYSS